MAEINPNLWASFARSYLHGIRLPTAEEAGYLVYVNAEGDGFTYATTGTAVLPAFGAPEAYMHLRVDGTGSGTEWVALGSDSVANDSDVTGSTVSDALDTLGPLATGALPASGGTLTGNVACDPGVTVDGVDISAHAADATAHGSYLPLAGGALTGNVTCSAGVTIDGVDVGEHAATATAHGDFLLRSGGTMTGAINGTTELSLAIADTEVVEVTAAGLEVTVGTDATRVIGGSFDLSINSGTNYNTGAYLEPGTGDFWFGTYGSAPGTSHAVNLYNISTGGGIDVFSNDDVISLPDDTTMVVSLGGTERIKTTATSSSFGGNVLPKTDSTYSLGNGTFLWTDVYADSGSVNTSDARRKTAPLPVDDQLLDAWGDVRLIAFQWLASVERKGPDVARIHHGVIAQQVRDALAGRGLDGTRYGLLCYDEWDDQYAPDHAARHLVKIEIRKAVDAAVPAAEAALEATIVAIPEDATKAERKAAEKAARDAYRASLQAVRDSFAEREAEAEATQVLVKPAGDRWGIRPDQCLWVEAAYQRRRADRIEARLQALEEAVLG